MIDIEKIVTAFEDTVRFAQSENPDIPKLSPSLIEPAEARLVYHPVLKNENLMAIAPNYDTMNWVAWVDAIYPIYSTVSHNGTYWTASEAIAIGEEPGTSSKWLKEGAISNYLIERRREAIRTAIMDVYNAKKDNHITRETLGDFMLYEGSGNMNDTIINKGELVGLEFQLLENSGLNVILKQISLQFTGPQALNLYLWHSSQQDPIAAITLNYTKSYSVEWMDFDKTLTYRDYANNQDNGLYYLGYYQNTITEQAIRKRFNFGTIPCGTCSQYNKRAYKNYSQYIRVRAFRISNPPAGNKLWNVVNDTVYVHDTNHGINFRIQPNCDITQYIIDRKPVFADVITHQLRYSLLLEVANTTRSNVLSEQVITMARGAIQPEHLGGEGESKKLHESKEAASLEMSDIEKNVCMPRSKPKGVSSNNIRTGRGLNGNYGHSGFGR